MPLILGNQPDTLEVWVTPNADFYETLEAMDPTQQFPQPWDVGSQVYLLFETVATQDPVRWNAAVETNLTSWAIQSDAVADLILASPVSVTLWYENGIVKVPLAVGTVKVYG